MYLGYTIRTYIVPERRRHTQIKALNQKPTHLELLRAYS
jgi:hypothetical protein